MNYSSACSKATSTRPWPRRRRPRCGARCAKCERAAGRPRARDRLRLGRAGRGGGARVRRPRHRRHAVDRAARVRHERACAATAWPTAPTCACRTTATSPTSPSTPSSRSRCSRPSAANTGPASSTRCSDQLKPGGRACIQTITIRDDLFERYVAVHRLHPAVHLPRRPAAQPAARSAPRPRKAGPGGRERTRLRPRLRRDAAPLARRLPGAATAQVRKLGFDTRFMRIWEFYLAYCEAAFDTGNTNVMQFTLRRPTEHDRDAAAAPAAAAAAAGRGQRVAPRARWRNACTARGGGRTARRAAAGQRPAALLRPARLRRPAVAPSRASATTTGRSAAAGAGAASTPARSTASCIAERSLERDAAQQAEIAAETGARWLGAMTRLFPDVHGRRPHHRRAPARHGRTLLRQRRAARRGARRRLRAPLLRHLAVAAHLGARAARSAARRPWPRDACTAPVAAPAPRRLARRLARTACATARWACRWPSWRCRCTWCCPTTTPASSACRWPRWARCCSARGCSTPWPTPGSAAGSTAGSRARRARVLAVALRRGAGAGARAFAASFFPPVQGSDGVAGLVRGAAGRHLPRATACVSVMHQAWGARLGGDEAQRARIVAWREGLALARRAGGQRAAVGGRAGR